MPDDTRDLTIRWPDEDVERIDAARGRLDVARARLLERGFDEVLGVLAEVFDRWRDPASIWRRRLLDAHPAAAGFSRPVVEAGLDLGLADWSGAALRRAVQGERHALQRERGRVVAPFASTSIVLAGAIPMPSLLQPTLSLALLSPVLVKPASRDLVTPRLLKESIADVDEEVGRAIEVVSFPADDTTSLARFLLADCVVVSGSDETVASVGQQLHAGQRYVAYGHKLSIGVLDADGVANAEQAGPLARAVATDVALWDQQGCLSPVAIYVVGPDAPARAASFAEALARALAECATRLPRGDIAPSVAAAIVHERSAAELRAADGAAVHLHAGDGTSWTVVAEPDARWRRCPLHRFVRVHPVANAEALDDAVRPIAQHLSAVGLAIGPERRPDLEARLFDLGASRVCEPGRMQAPRIDWPHDGRGVLAPLARLAASEADGGT